MLRLLFNGSVPKEVDYADANEDAYCYSEELGRFAIGDGASESFDSKKWANLITSLFVENPSIDAEWVLNATQKYNNEIDYEQLSWSRQAAYDRGSFTTIVGITTNLQKQRAEIVGIGDSVAILLENREIIASFPITRSEQFSERPRLISTIHAHNLFIGSSTFVEGHFVTWDLQANSEILLMSDALACWCLNSVENREEDWRELLDIESLDSLSSLISRLRYEKKIRIDDSTLLRLKMANQ